MQPYRTKTPNQSITGLGLNNPLQRTGRLQRVKGLQPNKNDEQGIIIVLVAVFMLGAVGAMAALSIDVVTLYTARSEAQLAADAGALAGARALANSGATSDATGALMALAEPIASKVALQVAQSSTVGGRNLVAANGEVTVSFSDSATNPCVALNPVTNPCVTVSVQRIDLPTFFARIWGSTQIKVVASATAEAYNPSNISGAAVNSNLPVATTCVKPWLLPNIDPTSPGAPKTIFDPVSGAISNSGLLGYSAITPPSSRLHVANPPFPASASSWAYYPGDTGSTYFQPPAAASVACTGSAGFTPYQLSIAGCVPRSIACNSTINIVATYPSDIDAGAAVNCLAHSVNSGGDRVDNNASPTPPFQFTTGADNPLVQAGALAQDTDVMVSSSLVTVPVFDNSTWAATYPNVQIIGFVQLFLQPDGNAVRLTTGNPATRGYIKAKVINMVGCGTSATGTPILGNGASPVAVRLISP